jgi:hypothetical protein
MSAGIDEGLREQHGMTVDSLPIAVESTQVGSQNLGRQTLEAYPGQYEEAPVGDEQWQLRVPARAVPADKAVPRGTPRYGRAPIEQRDQLIAHQSRVAHRLADGAFEPEVVEALQMEAETVTLLAGDWSDSQRSLGLAVDVASNDTELVEYAYPLALWADAPSLRRGWEPEHTALLQMAQHH